MISTVESIVLGELHYFLKHHSYEVVDVSFYLNGVTQNKNLDLDDMLPQYQGSPPKIIKRLVLYVSESSGSFGSLKCLQSYLIYDEFGNYELVPANTVYEFTHSGRYFIVRAG